MPYEKRNYDATRSTRQGDRHQCPHCKTWGEDWIGGDYESAPDHTYVCGTWIKEGDATEACDVIAALRAEVRDAHDEILELKELRDVE